MVSVGILAAIRIPRFGPHVTGHIRERPERDPKRPRMAGRGGLHTVISEAQKNPGEPGLSSVAGAGLEPATSRL